MNRPSLAPAMVLAAGRGTRMEPLSSVIPKPALPVLGEPVVAWAMRQAARAGAPAVTVNAWHLTPRMIRAVSRVDPGIPVAISREERLMDTAGGLALARERGLLGSSGPVLVLNGDGLYGLDLGPVLEAHADQGWDVTLALLPHLDPERWARVVLASDGRVEAIRPPGRPEPGEAPFLYPGAMVVSRDALNRIPLEPGGIPQLLWQPAMETGRMGGVVVAGHWREIGTPAAYLEAVLDLLGAASRIAQEAIVAESATIGRSVVGAGVTVGPGAVVAESVLEAGATVGEGARIIRSILIGPVSVAPGETVTGTARAAAP